MRRTIMRYANLSLLLVLRMISPAVKKRFPTLEHLVEAGFLLKNERNIFESLDTKSPHPKYWLPLVWAAAVARRARREGKVPDDFALKTLIDEIVKFRGGCGGLLNYDWISIPLVYTQVVTLAVYSYFAASLMGNQYLDPLKGYPKHQIDLVVPVFTFLQFFFYMGWLLVAETLVNPFGEDDDDFEVNWLIDRNLQISYLIVDEMHEEHPELIRDQYWEQVFPAELPYTEAAKHFHAEPYLGSAFGVAVPEHMQTFLILSDQMKEERGETTPVLINAPPRNRVESLSTIQMMGSSMSLPLKKWKRTWKPVPSQRYSMNSICKINDDDYPDDVFSMSGLSFCSNKMLSTHINIKDTPTPTKKSNYEVTPSTSSEGITCHSNSLTLTQGHGQTEKVLGDIEHNISDVKDEKSLEANQGAVQLWRSGPTEVIDICRAQKIDCAALDYEALNILLPEVEGFLLSNQVPSPLPHLASKQLTPNREDEINKNEEPQ